MDNGQLKIENARLPKGWEIKKLGDVLKLEYGKPLDKSKRKSAGLYPVYGANGIKARSDESYYDKQSIIVGRKGSAGEINLTENNFWPLDVTYFVTFDDKKYDLFFLFYLLSKLALPRLAKGVKPGINRNDVYSLTASIPPLPEQKRIVAVLDKAFLAIDKVKANAEKNLANAKELFESYLNGIFENPGEDWEEKELKEIGVIQTGTTPPTKDKSNYGDYISFVKPAHFKTDGSITTEDSMLSETGLNKGRLFEANSVLMVCIGATIGKTGFSETPVSANQQINALTPSTKYVPKFLYYALISPFVQKQVMIQGKSAQATLPIINKSKWGKLKVNLPKDKKIQTKIVRTLENLKVETKHLEKIYQQKIDHLNELKKSILQKAFKGKL